MLIAIRRSHLFFTTCRYPNSRPNHSHQPLAKYSANNHTLALDFFFSRRRIKTQHCSGASKNFHPSIRIRKPTLCLSGQMNLFCALTNWRWKLGIIPSWWFEMVFAMISLRICALAFINKRNKLQPKQQSERFLTANSWLSDFQNTTVFFFLVFVSASLRCCKKA